MAVGAAREKDLPSTARRRPSSSSAGLKSFTASGRCRGTGPNSCSARWLDGRVAMRPQEIHLRGGQIGAADPPALERGKDGPEAVGSGPAAPRKASWRRRGVKHAPTLNQAWGDAWIIVAAQGGDRRGLDGFGLAGTQLEQEPIADVGEGVRTDAQQPDALDLHGLRGIGARERVQGLE